MRNSMVVIAWLLCLIVVSCSPKQATQSPEPTQAASPTVAPRPTPPGQMVDVGGYQLYLYCTGTGSPTVILEAGLEGDDISWKLVQPEVAQFTRVCSYDRAGLAHSDYGPTPRDAEMSAADLHTLLTKAGIDPPYVMVGHSFGGLLIRRFAFDYPGEVDGLVFVDSLHEDWWEEALKLLPPASSNDSGRLASFRNYLADGWRDPSNNFEAMDIPAVVEQVRETGDFGDLPIIVLTAGKFTVLNPGLPPDLEAGLASLFHDLQGRLAALSTVGSQVVIPDSGHDIPRENPQAIVDAIRTKLSKQ
jgi:pimeloyl-ACP methyl ester carboxylesterase